MSVLLSITAGWTGVLGPFTLLLDGQPIDLTNMTVALVLRNSSGILITPGGTVTVAPDQVTNRGQVTYAPVEADFVFELNRYTTAQAYQLRWKVTDLASKIVYFPNGPADVVMVYRA